MTKDEARLVALYTVAAKEIKMELLAVDPEDYQSDVAARAMARIRDTVDALSGAARRWLDGAVNRRYTQAAARARTALEILGAKPRKQRYDKHRMMLIEDTAIVLERANRSIVDMSSKILAVTALAANEISRAKQGAQVQEFDFADVSHKIMSWATKVVRAGDSAWPLVKKVRAYLIGLTGDSQFIDIKGRRYNMRKYSELVANTTLSEAQTAATLDLCDQYENDLVQWSDHGTECAECEAYEGNVYSISGRHPHYPYLDAEPPIHPNCEHSLLPTSDIALSVSKKYGRYQTPGQLMGG